MDLQQPRGVEYVRVQYGWNRNHHRCYRQATVYILRSVGDVMAYITTARFDRLKEKVARQNSEIGKLETLLNQLQQQFDSIILSEEE